MITEKKSIIKEAVIDFNEIMDAATNKAKTKLAEEFPDKFNNLIKEELKNKKTINDNYKKITTTEEPNKIVEINTINMEKNTKKSVNEGIVTPTSTPKPQPVEEFNITELDLSSVGSALNGAKETDEVITMNEIQDELAKLDLGNNTKQSVEETKLCEMKTKLQEMINSIDEETNKFNINKLGSNVATPPESKKPTPAPTTIEEIETDAPISDTDINNVLNTGGNKHAEPPVDEAHGLAYASRRNNPGRHLPDTEHLSQGELDQSPEYIKESKTKISGLIKENKSLTKKLNEAKKDKDTVGDLLENYNTAIGKYRKHLTEMAVLNTNLAHVNNILINEDLALTHDDKLRIINEFKNINDIKVSQDKYKSIITEMKNNTKTITETIADKVSTSIQPSAKPSLVESVVEKTAYTNDLHLQKILKTIEYVEQKKRR
jgi:hypothetical protein